MNARLEDVTALTRRIHGYKMSRMIGLAADLGIVDQIDLSQNTTYILSILHAAYSMQR